MFIFAPPSLPTHTQGYTCEVNHGHLRPDDFLRHPSGLVFDPHDDDRVGARRLRVEEGGRSGAPRVAMIDHLMQLPLDYLDPLLTRIHAVLLRLRKGGSRVWTSMLFVCDGL